LTREDFSKFAIIAALDREILAECEMMRPSDSTAKVVLFNAPKGIEDPYYGDAKGFETMCENITKALRPFLSAHGLI
jgi:protein-tyrosine phosphatase